MSRLPSQLMLCYFHVWGFFLYCTLSSHTNRFIVFLTNPSILANANVKLRLPISEVNTMLGCAFSPRYCPVPRKEVNIINVIFLYIYVPTNLILLHLSVITVNTYNSVIHDLAFRLVLGFIQMHSITGGAQHHKDHTNPLLSILKTMQSLFFSGEFFSRNSCCSFSSFQKNYNFTTTFHWHVTKRKGIKAGGGLENLDECM